MSDENSVKIGDIPCDAGSGGLTNCGTWKIA